LDEKSELTSRIRRMKSSIYFGVILFLFACGTKQKEDQVKELSVYQYKILNGKKTDKRLVEKQLFNEKSLLISEIHYDELGSIDYKTEYSYDSKGRKIKDVYTLHGKCHSISEFHYQKNDSLSVIGVFKPNKKIDFVIQTHYNELGYNDKDLAINEDHSIRFWDRYIRNKSGRLEQWIRYNGDSSIRSTVIYEYDGLNREIKNTGSGELGGTYSFKYNEKGLKSEEIRYNTIDKQFLWLKVYSYNKSNRISKIVEYNDLKDRPENSCREFHYEYKFW
jgi:hypothetical protein